LETETVTESNEGEPEPSLERRTRRQFTGAEKQRLLAEMDARAHGEKGAWLRRNGLYAAQLAQWRKTLAESGVQGLEPTAGGRKPGDARERESERLKRDKARLEQRLQTAEELIELQKKLPGLIDRVESSYGI